MKPIWLLLISVISAVTGQVLFKKGVLVTGEITFKGSMMGELIKLIFNPLVFSGLILYVVSADPLAHRLIKNHFKFCLSLHCPHICPGDAFGSKSSFRRIFPS